MNVSRTSIYLYFLLLLVATGCTKISPQLGFGLLKSSDESLTIESNLETINLTSANSTVQLKGLCEANTNLNIIGPNNLSFKCENLSYLKELPANLFNEGENVISVEAYDNSSNKIAGKTLKITKDTIPPTVSISGPSSVPGTDTEIPLNGTCSENGSVVSIQDLVNETSASINCIGGAWSYSAPVVAGSLATVLSYKAQHSDVAGNITTSNSISVSRTMAAVFTITGVRNSGAEFPGNLLKSNSGSLSVNWSTSIPAASYDVYIERNYLSTASAVCSQTGATGIEAIFSLGAGCALNLGENLRIKVLGWNAAHTASATEYFIFSVKAAPTLRSDANILYINSDPETAVSTVKIAYADFINDPVAVGPFTVTVTDAGLLAGMVAADNISASHTLNISPTITTSGIFPISIKIADENAMTSEDIVLKIAIVYPYSWSGLVSTNFSTKGNWCGVAGLKSGCTGVSNLPSSSTRIFMDNLCEQPTQAATDVNCTSILSADTTVRSMNIKYGTFKQDNYIFSVGTVSDSGSYFKMSAGTFNDGSVGGTLNIFKAFTIEGGVFNAPKNSDIILNTNMASASDAFKVLNAINFNHNNSTLVLTDPTGQGITQNILVPNGFALYNLRINSNGGYWAIKSTGLSVLGDLTLSGTKDSSNNYPLLNSAIVAGKINLHGNLNCTGNFGGGNLPVYMVGSSANYKTSYSGCKLPQIKVAVGSANVTESSFSTEDTTLNSLSVTAGTFAAPTSSRKLIFKSRGLDDNTVVADLNNGGFSHNSGTVVFETASSALNYKISLPSIYDLIFTNPSNLSSFYDIQNSFSGNSLYLKGTYDVPIRGAGLTITFNQLTFDAGFVADANQITRLVQQSSGSSYVTVNTSNRLNIPQLEMINAYGFNGSSNLFDLSGTNLILSMNNIFIAALQELKYFSKTGAGNISGLGVYGSGY